MKKSIFSALGLLLFAASLPAQQFSFGIRAGYTHSDVIIREPDGLVVDGNPDFQLDGSYRPLGSLHAGIDARTQIGGRFAIVSGLQYARKGYTDMLFWPSGPADALWQLHYLNLPVVADFRIWKGLSVQAGLEAGWLVDVKVKSAGEAFDPEDLFGSYNDFDLGIAGGMEYRFNDSFFAAFRHIFGILPLSELELTDQNGAALDQINSRNSATQVSVGYRYVFGE